MDEYHHTKQSFVILSRLEDLAFQCIRLLQLASRGELQYDRLQHHESLAGPEEFAAVKGDMRTSFKVVKKIGGFTIRAPKIVRLVDGSLSTSEEQRQERWQQHFCQLMSGKLSEAPMELITSPSTLVPPEALSVTDASVSPQRLLGMIKKMGVGKGLGPDLIPVELLKAGGFPLALALSQIAWQNFKEE